MQKIKFLNFRPFVFTAVSLALGIVSASLFYMGRTTFAIIVCSVFALLLALFIFFTGNGFKKKLCFAVAFVLLFCCGLTSALGKVNDYDKADLNSHYYSVRGKVVELGQTEYGTKLVLDDLYLDDNKQTDYKMAVYVYGETDVDIGNVISFYSLIKDNEAIYEGNLSATNIERGIKYNCSLSSDYISVVGVDKTVFDRVHLFFRDTLKKGLGEREFSTAYGLLIGNTEDMDYELITSYRLSGVAHIFAVSGLHIGFLATVLNFILNKLKVNKIAKAFLITIILLFYSGVCGFSASSIRATVMSMVMLFSSIRGRRYDGLSSVGVACTLILLYSPLQLLCVGFQLSFVVVLGIILISKPISRLFSFLPQKVANAIGVVLSAFVSGIPVQLATFGQFSLFGILANLILIPVVGILYVALFVGVLIGGAFGIEVVALFLQGYAIKLINAIITALDYKAFIVSGFVMSLFAIFYYLALVIPTGLFKMKTLAKIIASTLCAVICVVGTIVYNVSLSNKAKAYVIGSDTECATVIENDGETIMIVSVSGDIPSLSRFKRLRDKQGVTNVDKLVFTKGATSDMQVYLTRLNTVFDIEYVYYAGEQKQDEESAIRASFGIGVRACSDGESLSNTLDCKFILDGKAVEVNVNDNKMAIFSKMNGFVGKENEKQEYSFIVMVDCVDQIVGFYQPKKCISYRNHALYPNADSTGTALIYIE